MEAHQPREQLSVKRIEKAYTEPAALEGEKKSLNIWMQNYPSIPKGIMVKKLNL